MNNKQLAVIHVAKKQLGLDDEAYRASLLAHGGVDSARELDREGFQSVMKHFEASGFKSKTTGKPQWTPPRMGPGMASDGQVKKIIALWYTMPDYYRKGNEMKALNAFLSKTCGVSRLEWLTPKKAHNAIEAIKDIAKRRAA